MAAGRKQVAFDLNTKALELYYPSEHWNAAYDVIKRHMQKNDFTWLQGSVYVSNSPRLSRDVSSVLENLVLENPWLNVCMRDCRQSNIGKEHDQNYLFDKSANVPTRDELNAAKKDVQKPDVKVHTNPPSILDRIRRKGEEYQKAHQNDQEKTLAKSCANRGEER